MTAKPDDNEGLLWYGASKEQLRITGTPFDHDGLLWHGKVQIEIAID